MVDTTRLGLLLRSFFNGRKLMLGIKVEGIRTKKEFTPEAIDDAIASGDTIFLLRWSLTDPPDVKSKIDGLEVGHVPLAIKMASKEIRFRRSWVELEEIVSAGLLGLVKAGKKYDPGRGDFTTYAWWQIRKEVGPACTDTPFGRIYDYTIQLIGELQRAQKQQVDLGGPVNNQQLAQGLGWKRGKVLEVERINEQRGTYSLDAVPECLERRDRRVDVERKTEDLSLSLVENARLREAVDSLPPANRQVIKLRYGLDGGPDNYTKPLTMKDTAAKTNTSLYLVRQAERRALELLRQMLQEDEI